MSSTSGAVPPQPSCPHGAARGSAAGGRRDGRGPHGVGLRHRKQGPGLAWTASREVMLLGNLQAGKTTLFHRLCGERAWHGPVPESSKDFRRGRLVPVLSSGHRLWHRLLRLPDDHLETPTVVVDTPGIAGLLHPQSEAEQAVHRALVASPPAVVLVVADARNLRRSLALLLQAALLDRPMVLALTMQDLAGRGAPLIDTAALEALLGIPVVATAARSDEGIRAVHRAIERARRPSREVRLPRRLRTAVSALEAQLSGLSTPPRASALMLLAGDPLIRATLERELDPGALGTVFEQVDALQRDVHLPLDSLLTDILYREAERLAAAVSSLPADTPALARRLGDLAQHPVWGVPIALAVVALMYIWVGEIGATRVVDALNGGLFQGILVPWCERALAPLPWPIVREALLDPDFGLLTTGLFLAFGIVLPVLFFFYLAFAVLNQSGYLARLTILLDRLLRGVGLNGKGVMPIAMGFSCVTMALITTRMLETRRERMIASFLLMLGVPCAPLLAVMLVILGDMPFGAAVAVFLIIGSQIAVAGAAADRALGGRISDFIMEMPPLRWPDPWRVLTHTVRETWSFMREAVPYFLAASLALFIADRLGGLDLLERGAHPLTAGLLGLPDEAVQVFIKTLIRRENGATELDLVRAGFTNLQVVVTLLMMVLLTPCVNAVLVLYKEQGVRDATLIIVAVTTWALAVGAAVFHGCSLLGITFA
jgi:ferrous iron transport protein B